VPHPFWHPEALPLAPVSPPDAAVQTRTLFADAVRLCLRSDVPVGVCLSGGLDSSAILSQMQRLKSVQDAPTYAFSAAFPDPGCDERRHIATMLAATQTQGFATLPTGEGFVADCDTFLYHHDEPPGSLSQYAAWTVMRLARAQTVPVLLSGQGGDELFAGYRPAYYLWLARLLRHAPWRAVLDLLGALLPTGNPALWRQVLPHLRQYWWRRRQPAAVWAQTVQTLTPGQYRLALAPLLPASICWRRDKLGFETPQAAWMRTTLRPLLARWVDTPSAALQTLVPAPTREALARVALGPQPLSVMDERPKALMRLYFLDRWLTRFGVDLPEDAHA
jgi:asparagine synthetase B (glutamine-hydrolysing)